MRVLRRWKRWKNIHRGGISNVSQERMRLVRDGHYSVDGPHLRFT